MSDSTMEKSVRRGAIFQQKSIRRKETRVVSKTHIQRQKDIEQVKQSKMPIFISLVSQTKHRITIEIILDTNLPGQDVGNMAAIVNKKQE